MNEDNNNNTGYIPTNIDVDPLVQRAHERSMAKIADVNLNLQTKQQLSTDLANRKIMDLNGFEHGQITYVTDGDTFKLTDVNGQSIDFRLGNNGIEYLNTVESSTGIYENNMISNRSENQQRKFTAQLYGVAEHDVTYDMMANVGNWNSQLSLDKVTNQSTAGKFDPNKVYTKAQLDQPINVRFTRDSGSHNRVVGQLALEDGTDLINSIARDPYNNAEFSLANITTQEYDNTAIVEDAQTAMNEFKYADDNVLTTYLKQMTAYVNATGSEFMLASGSLDEASDVYKAMTGTADDKRRFFARQAGLPDSALDRVDASMAIAMEKMADGDVIGAIAESPAILPELFAQLTADMTAQVVATKAGATLGAKIGTVAGPKGTAAGALVGGAAGFVTATVATTYAQMQDLARQYRDQHGKDMDPEKYATGFTIMAAMNGIAGGFLAKPANKMATVAYSNITKALGTSAGKKFSSIFAKSASKSSKNWTLASAGKNIAVGTSAEGLTEWPQAALENVITGEDRIALENILNAMMTPEAAYEGILGALVGGGFSAVPEIAGGIDAGVKAVKQRGIDKATEVAKKLDTNTFTVSASTKAAVKDGDSVTTQSTINGLNVETKVADNKIYTNKANEELETVAFVGKALEGDEAAKAEYGSLTEDERAQAVSKYIFYSDPGKSHKEKVKAAKEILDKLRQDKETVEAEHSDNVGKYYGTEDLNTVMVEYDTRDGKDGYRHYKSMIDGFRSVLATDSKETPLDKLDGANAKLQIANYKAKIVKLHKSLKSRAAKFKEEIRVAKTTGLDSFIYQTDKGTQQETEFVFYANDDGIAAAENILMSLEDSIQEMDTILADLENVSTAAEAKTEIAKVRAETKKSGKLTKADREKVDETKVPEQKPETKKQVAEEKETVSTATDVKPEPEATVAEPVKTETKQETEVKQETKTPVAEPSVSVVTEEETPPTPTHTTTSTVTTESSDVSSSMQLEPLQQDTDTPNDEIVLSYEEDYGPSAREEDGYEFDPSDYEGFEDGIGTIYDINAAIDGSYTDYEAEAAYFMSGMAQETAIAEEAASVQQQADRAAADDYISSVFTDDAKNILTEVSEAADTAIVEDTAKLAEAEEDVRKAVAYYENVKNNKQTNTSLQNFAISAILHGGDTALLDSEINAVAEKFEEAQQAVVDYKEGLDSAVDTIIALKYTYHIDNLDKEIAKVEAEIDAKSDNTPVLEEERRRLGKRRNELVSSRKKLVNAAKDLQKTRLKNAGSNVHEAMKKYEELSNSLQNNTDPRAERIINSLQDKIKQSTKENPVTGVNNAAQSGLLGTGLSKVKHKIKNGLTLQAPEDVVSFTKPTSLFGLLKVNTNNLKVATIVANVANSIYDTREEQKGAKRSNLYTVESGKLEKVPARSFFRTTVSSGAANFNSTILQDQPFLIYLLGGEVNPTGTTVNDFIKVNEQMAMAMHYTMLEMLVREPEFMSGDNKRNKEIMEELGILNSDGILRSTAANMLGQRLFSAMGIQASDKATETSYAALLTSAGNQMLVYAEQQGWITDVKNDMLNENNEVTGTVHTIVSNIESMEGYRELADEVRVVGEYVTNEASRINRARHRPHRSDKDKDSNVKLARRKHLETNDDISKAIVGLNKTPTFVNKEVVKFIKENREQLLQYLGYDAAIGDGSKLKRNKYNGIKAVYDSILSKNRQILRSIDNLIMYAEDPLGGPHYWKFEASDNVRVFMTGQGNPQNDKFARFLWNMAKASQRVAIPGSPAVDAMMDDNSKATAAKVFTEYKYAIAQAFGCPVDKTSSVEIDDFATAVIDHFIASDENIAQFEKDLLEGKLNNHDVPYTIDGHHIDVENLGHMLVGLQSLKSYRKSIVDGTGVFNSSLVAEVDGTTNGYEVSSLQTPFAELERFARQLGTGTDDVAMHDNKSEAGFKDVYKESASVMSELMVAVNSDSKDTSVVEAKAKFKRLAEKAQKDNKKALWGKEPPKHKEMTEITNSIMKPLANLLPKAGADGEISKALRDVFKNLVMTFGYGAGKAAASRGLSREILENNILKPINVYLLTNNVSATTSLAELQDRITKQGKGPEEVIQALSFLRQIQQHVVKGSQGLTVKDIQNLNSRSTLYNKATVFISSVYSDIAYATLEESFKPYRRRMDTINRAVRAMGEAYAVAFNEERINILEKSGNSSLTKAEVKQLINKTKKLLPGLTKIGFTDKELKDIATEVMAIYEDTKDFADSVIISNSDKAFEYTPGSSIAITPDTTGAVAQLVARKVTGKISGVAASGAGGGAISTHSVDSTTLSRTLNNVYGRRPMGALPVFDAIVAFPGEIDTLAYEYNKNLYDISQEYKVLDAIKQRFAVLSKEYNKPGAVVPYVPSGISSMSIDELESLVALIEDKGEDFVKNSPLAVRTLMEEIAIRKVEEIIPNINDDMLKQLFSGATEYKKHKFPADAVAVAAAYGEVLTVNSKGAVARFTPKEIGLDVITLDQAKTMFDYYVDVTVKNSEMYDLSSKYIKNMESVTSAGVYAVNAEVAQRNIDAANAEVHQSLGSDPNNYIPEEDVLHTTETVMTDSKAREKFVREVLASLKSRYGISSKYLDYVVDLINNLPAEQLKGLAVKLSTHATANFGVFANGTIHVYSTSGVELYVTMDKQGKVFVQGLNGTSQEAVTEIANMFANENFKGNFKALEAKVKERFSGEVKVDNNYRSEAEALNAVLLSDKHPVEIFAHELVHAYTHTFLSLGSRFKPQLQKLLYLQRKASKVITPADLVVNPKPTAKELEKAQDLWDYMFLNESKNVDDFRSLAEFMAHGLTNEKVMKKLENLQINETKRSMSALGRLKSVFLGLVKVLFSSTKFDEQFPNFVDILLGNLSIKQENAFDALTHLVQNMVEVNGKAVDTVRKDYLQVLEGPTQSLGKAINAVDERGAAFIDRVLGKAKIDKYSIPFHELSLPQKVLTSVRRLIGLTVAKDARNTQELLMEQLGIKPDSFISMGLRDMQPLNEYEKTLERLALHTRYAESLSKQAESTIKHHLLNAFGVDDKGNSTLTKEDARLLTYGIMKTDLQCLLDVTGDMTDEQKQQAVMDMLDRINNPDTLDQEIEDAYSSLVELVGTSDVGFLNYLSNHIKNTALSLSDSGYSSINMFLNADAIIANGLKSRNALATKLSKDTKVQMTQLVDKLISLEAYKHNVTAEEKIRLSNLSVEGMTSFLLSHKLAVQSIQREGETIQDQQAGKLQAMHIQKGYTKQLISYQSSMVFAPTADAEELAKSGYVKISDIKPSKITGQKGLSVYKSAVSRLQQRNGAALTFKGQYAQGTTLANIAMNQVDEDMLDMLKGKEGSDYSETVPATKEALVTIAYQQTRAADAKFSTRSFSMEELVNLKEQNGEAFFPVLNSVGDIVDYRVSMSDAMKEKHFEMDTDGINVLSSFFKSYTLEKSTAVINNQIIDEVFADMRSKELSQSGFMEKRPKNSKEKYVALSPYGANADTRNAYNMLPAAVKQYIKEKLNAHNKNKPMHEKIHEIYVPETALTRLFGVASMSLVDAKYVKGLSRQAKYAILVAEEIMKFLSQFVKLAIAVKTPMVIAVNVLSNIVLATIKGQNPTKVIGGYLRYIRFTKAYMTKRRELDALKWKSNILTLTRQEQVAMQVLEKELALNPVDKLVKVGLWTPVVEDIRTSELENTSRVQKKINQFLVDKKVPGPVISGFKYLYMMEDTALFKLMSTAVHYSDFIARAVDYDKMMEKASSLPKDKKQQYENAVISELMARYINYDTANSAVEQYINDIGLAMFTKYMKRVQPVILGLIKEKPVTSALYLLSQYALVDVPDIYESYLSVGNVANRLMSPQELIATAVQPPLLNLV